MDSTPPSHRPTPHSHKKSASRLARTRYSAIESSEEFPRLSLDLVALSPKETPSPSGTSVRSSGSIPLRELLLLSPSLIQRSRKRLADKLEMATEESMEPKRPHRRCKNRTAQMAQIGYASPRNNRKTRRRSEIEIREEKDLCSLEEGVSKGRKRKPTGRTKKEKPGSVHSMPTSRSFPQTDDGGQGNLDRISEMITDLVMWRDVAKSTLWFGFGCLGFLSSCFSSSVSFSIFSVISQLGLLFLGASFFSNSFSQSKREQKRREFKLSEDDVLRVARLILPATNLALLKTSELFSGEPSMTLKVIPFLLLGAEYGHLITLWRLCATAFLLGFTVPKLYSNYSSQINQKVENKIKWVMEAWGTCSHKRVVAASAVTAFWNLSSIKTRIFTAFICLVVIRCFRQHLVSKSDEGLVAEVDQEEEEEEQKKHDVVMVVAEGGEHQKI